MATTWIDSIFETVSTISTSSAACDFQDKLFRQARPEGRHLRQKRLRKEYAAGCTMAIDRFR